MSTHRGWFQVGYVRRAHEYCPPSPDPPYIGACSPFSTKHTPQSTTCCPPLRSPAHLAPFAGPLSPPPPWSAEQVVQGQIPESQPVHSDAAAVGGAARDCAALARPRVPCRGRKPDVERWPGHLPSPRGRHGAEEQQGRFGLPSSGGGMTWRQQGRFLAAAGELYQQQGRVTAAGRLTAGEL